jgi:glycosyltransferase involved in cell wall biosynthesis
MDARSRRFDGERIPVGIWAQWPPGARWANEGMTRLLGFLIEGIALDRRFVFRIVLPDWIRGEAEHDLRTLAAERELDYTLHSPADHAVEADDMEQLAEFANSFVPVQGWLSVFPNFGEATRLQAPLAVIFPDAIPKVFHEFSDAAWGQGGIHRLWQEQVAKLVGGADRLITFSRHVRDRQLGPIFGVEPNRVAVVPHATPDLAPALPFVAQRTRTRDSVAEAAALLREHAAERGWDYLRDYPFEDVPYIAVSTQDRVTKNVRLILDSVLRLVRRQRWDLKIISTAPLHYGADWTPLPATIERQLAHRDLVAVPDLPREQHAAFYHCAAVAVHASIFEGGHAPFPFYEAVSVGTPCLMARGPHTAELMEEAPELAPYTFDPDDAEGLAAMIVHVLQQRDEVLAAQQAVYERLSTRGWADVSAAYAMAAVAERATGAADGPDFDACFDIGG